MMNGKGDGSAISLYRSERAAPMASAPTVEEYVARFLRRAQARLRPNSHRVYRSVLTHHVLPALGTTPLKGLTRPRIRRLLVSLLEAGNAPMMVRCIHVALSAVLTMAEDDGLLTENPAHGAGKRLWTRKSLPRAIPLTAIDALVARALEVAPRFGALFLLQARTGLRLGEVLALRKEHVNLTERSLRVAETYHGGGRFGPPKSGRPRDVDLSDEAASALEALCRASTSGYLFAHLRKDLPYHPARVDEVFRRIATAVGLPDAVTPHSLRHSVATALLGFGAPPQYVQSLLGHRSIVTTVDLYGAGHGLRGTEWVDRLDRERKHRERDAAAHGPRRAR